MFASFNARAVGLASLSAEATIDIAADAEFEAVDLMVRDLVRAGVEPETLRSRMDDRGLRGGAFPCPIEWRGDEETFRRGLDELPCIAQFAATLGLFSTGTWVMPETFRRPLSDADRRTHRAEVARLHVQRLGAIAEILNFSKIRLGLEVIGVESFRTGQGEPFVARLGDLDRELGAIWAESPKLGILLDAFHLYAANESIDAGLAWGVERICWVHVADLPPGSSGDRPSIVDANRGLPGAHGAVDVRGFLTRLAQEGYEGPVTAEPLANCQELLGLEPRSVAKRVKQALDGVWPTG